MITAGIDCGTRRTKAVVLAGGRLAGRATAATSGEPQNAARRALEEALAQARLGRERLAGICATGAGRAVCGIADTVDEVAAMARGVFFFFPEARTAADVGAEEARAAKLDAGGRVVDQAVNERCAAGAGTFIETVARALELDLERMAELGAAPGPVAPMNSQCVVFAEAEMVALIHAGTPREDICRAVHAAVAAQAASLIRRIGVNREVALIGGLAANAAFTAALQRELGLERLLVPPQPELGAALGAALAAAGSPAKAPATAALKDPPSDE